MQIFRWAGIAVAIFMIITCFLPWMELPARNLVITGWDTEGTRFGKPGLFHIIFSVVYCILLLANKIVSKRIAFFICAINIAWAFRNLMILSSCFAGECPVRLYGLYLSFASALLMLIFALLSDYRTGKNISPAEIKQEDNVEQ